MEGKDEAFSLARDLILWLQNEFSKNTMRTIHNDMAQNSRILILNLLCFFGPRASFFLSSCPSANWCC
jgi:hypothetical protein